MLGLLNLAFKFANSSGVLCNINILLVIQVNKEVDSTLVKFLATYMSITSSGENFNHTAIEGQKSDIKGDTKIIYNNMMLIAING